MVEPPMEPMKISEKVEKPKPLSSIPVRLPMGNITNKHKNLNEDNTNKLHEKPNHIKNIANKPKTLIEDNIKKPYIDKNQISNIPKRLPKENFTNNPMNFNGDNISKFPIGKRNLKFKISQLDGTHMGQKLYTLSYLAKFWCS